MNALLFYILAVLLLLLALWKLANELVIGFTLPPESLAEQGAALLEREDLQWSDDLEEGSVRACLYESPAGEAAAVAFARGLFGRYKPVAVLEPGTEARELGVSGTEERVLLRVEPGADLEISGAVQQQSWFGMVVINLILCGVAVMNARKQSKAARAEESAGKKQD